MKVMLIQYPQFKRDELRYALFFDKTLYIAFSESKELYNDFMSKIDEIADDAYNSKLTLLNADFGPMLNEKYFSNDDLNSKMNKELTKTIIEHDKSFLIPTPSNDMFACCNLTISCPEDNIDYFECIKMQLAIAIDKYKNEIDKAYCNGYVRAGRGSIIDFKAKQTVVEE